MNTLFTIVMLTLVTLLTISNVVTAIFAYRMASIVMKVEDAITTSLDVLDERYGSLSMILEKPVFFDSMEVKQAVNDIKVARESILFVANEMSSTIDEQVVDEKEEFES